MMRALLFTALLGLVAAPDAAARDALPNQYGDRAKGWHFYEPDPPQPAAKKLLPITPPAPTAPSATEPAGPAPLSSAWLRENLPVYRDRAIDDPSPENVELLAYLQRLSVDRAERFSQVWARVTTSNPALDESARSPISAVQQSTARAQMSVAKKQAIEKITQRGGLWYFYLSTCPYCARQEPILERVQANLGLSILPISLDGGAPPTWPDAPFVNNDGHAEQLGVMVTPTMVMADTQTGELHMLAAGLRTDSEIETRLLEVGVTNGWITEVEYENAVRGEPRRFLAEGLPTDGLSSDDPAALLGALREASVTGGGASPWVVAPNQGTRE